MNEHEHPFLCGVIEGFYGRPWTRQQRLQLLDWMQAWSMDTYMYGPKDDIKIRARWRDRYTDAEASALGTLIEQCTKRGLRFVYAIAPGLDMRYSDPVDTAALDAKLEQLVTLGARDFTVLFDDIPHHMDEADRSRFGTFAHAQAHVCNHAYDQLREQGIDGRFFMCPTDYCGRMATPSVAESAYLRELGERLQPGIEVFWTGDEIVSQTITVESIRLLRRVLRRKPIIWDNLHANDYDIRRIYLGPFAGRPPALRHEVSGILTNPNCEFEPNYIAIRTLASYARDGDAYDPRIALREAQRAWLPAFATEGGEPLTLAEIELLCDAFYLPFERGPSADGFLATVEAAARAAPRIQHDQVVAVAEYAASVERVFTRLTELRNRDLLYALYRYVWELRTETGLVADHLRWLAAGPAPDAHFAKPDRIANTYRGGLAASVQHLLPMDQEGQARLRAHEHHD